MKVLSIVLAALISIPSQAGETAATTPECIGYASVDAEGNISLNLFSTDATHGGAMLLINKSHPLYEEIRQHVGRMRIGEWKCVKPWANEAAKQNIDEKNSPKRRFR